MYLKSIFTILLLALLIFNVNGQNESIEFTGQIFSKSNQPLAGVNIILKGSEIGTTSGLCGEYRLLIPFDSISTESLVFVFLSETTQEIKLSDLKSEKANFRLMNELTSGNRDCSERKKYKTYKVKSR